MSRAHQRWLLELTDLPTVAGKEDRVIAWVRRWAATRPAVILRTDRLGNLYLSRRGLRPHRPIFFTAHLDHPAFVVTSVDGPRRIVAEFRGGVEDKYFIGSHVWWRPAPMSPRSDRPIRGRVTTLTPVGDGRTDKQVTVEFPRPTAAQVGDVLTWVGAGRARLRGDRLLAPACDDLAGVAAALAAFDTLRRDRRHGGRVCVLLTRAEEVGFVGCIAACKSGCIPRSARIIALENSRSYAESPIGGGPIVRVGDLTSTFDPDLTYRVSRIAQDLGARDKGFQWQRKLMPGGTCEASAYGAYGYAATCLCLPLGNYHNMDHAAEHIAPETISVADFHHLVQLLVAIGRQLDDPARSPSLRVRLDKLFGRRRSILA